MSSNSESNETIKVVIAGIAGRMGRSSAQAILAEPGLELVGAFDRSDSPLIGKSLEKVLGISIPDKTDILVSNGFSDCLTHCTPDVVLDFTEAKSALALGLVAIEAKVRPVIGTSGIPADGQKALAEAASKAKIGALVIPNFSIGAILMMDFARRAAEHFEYAEVLETHRVGKLDAPSGTAMHTVKEIEKSGKAYNTVAGTEHSLLDGARGGKSNAGVRVHSIRMPGVLSHQDVIFGSDGEMLTIRHDSFNTSCFNPGIKLAIRSVMKLTTLAVGLDQFVLNG